MSDDNEAKRSHLTTRRGFILVCGFGVVSLYGLWAAYGAAPIGFSGKDTRAASRLSAVSAQRIDEHLAPQEFRRLAQEFVDSNRQADGSVKPSLPYGSATALAGAYIGEPVDVYVQARQYSYSPAVLRLERDVPYRFRIMSMDTDHGASIQFRGAAYMIRAPAEHVVEKVLVFREAGEYPVYCTVYCGLGHDLMKAKIVVE